MKKRQNESEIGGAVSPLPPTSEDRDRLLSLCPPHEHTDSTQSMDTLLSAARLEGGDFFYTRHQIWTTEELIKWRPARCRINQFNPDFSTDKTRRQRLFCLMLSSTLLFCDDILAQ